MFVPFAQLLGKELQSMDGGSISFILGGRLPKYTSAMLIGRSDLTITLRHKKLLPKLYIVSVFKSDFEIQQVKIMI